MASLVYNRAVTEFAKGNIAWVSATIKVALVGTGYTPNKDHLWNADIASSELNGTGYASGHGGSGRQAMANKTATQDDTNDRVICDADDTAFAAFNAGTAAYAIILKPGTSDDTTAIAIACMDIPNVTGNGTTLTVEWDATTGCFTIAT